MVTHPTPSLLPPLADRYLQGIAIVLSSFLVRGVVSVVISLTKPPQPNAVCAKEEQAYDFARDQV